MNKMKKLAALVLAMVMAFSLMAVTAAAAGAEEHEHDTTCCEATIQPRIPAMQCLECGTSMTPHTRYENGHYYVSFTCPKPGCGASLPEIEW